MANPKVSVVVPTHNRADRVGQAIESILAQTFQDFDILVTSDGSKDNTREVVCAIDDPRITFLEHETARGASAARNTAIRASRGQYIAFLDDDDAWEPHHLASLVPKLDAAQPEVGLIYAWMDYFQDGELVNEWHPTLRGDVLVEMLDKQAIGGCPTLLVRREMVELVGGFDETLPRGNDGDFIRRICQHCEVDFVPVVVARIHVGHGDRISVNSRKNLLNALIAFEKRRHRFRELFDEHPDAEANVLFRCVRNSLRSREYRRATGYLRELVALPLPRGSKAKFGLKVGREVVASVIKPAP